MHSADIQLTAYFFDLLRTIFTIVRLSFAMIGAHLESQLDNYLIPDRVNRTHGFTNYKCSFINTL
jgi:hypothetical protein